MTKPRKTAPEAELKVSTIELFFDLVFVFTITQLTHLVEHAHGGTDLFGAFLVLVLVWWMYAGYAWLTNAAGAEGGMRFVLIAAMAGFLVMALAIPGLFKEGGAAFGLAYLFVVLLHAGSFAYFGGRQAWGAVLGILGINAAASGLAVAAGLAAAERRWIYLLAGASMFIVSTLQRRERGFAVKPAHFAERHGLVILIALGESVIGIGTGASGRALNAGSVAALALALALVFALWWSYFGSDDRVAEHHLVKAGPEQRSRMALLGYWYAHLGMIAGIILVAAGLKQVLAQEGHGWAFLAGGLAAYGAGRALFRGIMGIGR